MLFNSLRDTPVLNIRELAKNPIEKTGQKRAITLILIMFFTLIFVGLYFVFYEDIKEYYLVLKSE